MRRYGTPPRQIEKTKSAPQTPGAALMSALDALNLSQPARRSGSRGSSKTASRKVGTVSRTRQHGDSLSATSTSHAKSATRRPREKLPAPLQIRYGANVALCGDQHFLATNPIANARLHADANANADDADAMFKLVNVNFRDHSGTLRYGDTVALTASNGMYVAVARSGGGGGPGLYRRAFGSNEKWVVVPASTLQSSTSSFALGGEVGAGSKIMLRNDKEGRYLAVRRGSTMGRPKAHWKVAAAPVAMASSVDRVQSDAMSGDEKNFSTVWTVLKPHTPATPMITTSSMPSAADRTIRNALQTTSLNKFSTSLQEHVIIEDLLFALTGIEGQYVLFRSSGVDLVDDIKATTTSSTRAVVPSYFYVDRSLSGMDASLSYLLTRMLPLCDRYYVVSNFIKTHAQYSFGRTVHALCAAMRELVKEYDLLLAQLEHQYRCGQMTLQKMWYFLQPSLSTLNSLAQVCIKSKNVVGGALLNTIKSVSARGGDERRSRLFSFLIERASVPFLKTLESWIYTGIIDDPYDEFMILERKELSKEALNQHFNSRYWNERYAVRKEYVPWFIRDTLGVSANILTTGKYLNVIRECHRPIKCPSATSISFGNRHQYVSIVGGAYEFASETLLRLVLNESKLLDHLRSIKEFFFLSRGDLFVHFMDTASEELSKNVSEVDIAKLESLLKLSLHTASTSADPNKDNLTCGLERYKLYRHLDAIHAASESEDPSIVDSTSTTRTSVRIGSKSPYAARRHSSRLSWNSESGGETADTLTGIEAFAFGYNVEWPLTLVISRQAMIKYQILFRHLFFCKHVELELCRVWLQMQTTKELDIRAAMGHSYSLRQRMIHFVQNLLYYVTVEVLEQRWHELDKNIRKSKNIDEVMERHNNFLDTCLKESLLTNQALHKIVTKLMATCLLFAKEMKSFYDGIVLNEHEGGDGEDKNGVAKRSPRLSRNTATRRATERSKEEQKRVAAYEDRKTRIDVQSQHIRKHVTQESYLRMLRGFRDHFDSLLKRFIASLRDESHVEYHLHLANMFTRLNFNDFYAMDEA